MQDHGLGHDYRRSKNWRGCTSVQRKRIQKSIRMFELDLIPKLQKKNDDCVCVNSTQEKRE